MTKTAFGAILALALMTASCGDGIGDVTSGGPSSTPTPAPTATPAPTPTPTPPPTANSTCRLPARQNCDAQCCSAGGSVIYRTEIDIAQNSVRTKRPELFFSNGNVRDNFEYLRVLSQEVLDLSSGQICAEPLGHDEIRIKGNQEVSQHVDVLVADVSPAILGAYTCRPASF